MSQSSKDFERCGMCSEYFNQDDHKPKFLQCYHTYCCKCLTRIQKNTKGGGVEFLCPSCQKLTKVGKKGVSALQDNFYLLSLSTHEDEVYKSDDEEDISTTTTAKGTKNRVVKVWCATCLKVAGSECSHHDICNLEQGKKCLNERLQSALEKARKELVQELKVRESQLAYLQVAHQAWKFNLAEHLEELINMQSLALTIAYSELESLNSLKEFQNKDDPTITALVVSNTEAMVTRVQSRMKDASKQEALLSILQTCQIEIKPVLDNNGKSKEKLQSLVIDVGESATNEEKALIYLMYHILENKARDKGTIHECWKVVEKAQKVKSKGGGNDETRNKRQFSKARSASVQRAGHNNLVSTAAISTESLPAGSCTKLSLNKDVGNLNKEVRCFFDIAVDGKMFGRIVIHLRPDVAPKMCANFVALCTGEVGYGYKGSKIFKAVANSHIIGGDFEKNDGSGGHSIYNNKGLFVADNSGLKDEKGSVRMKGMGTDEKTGGGIVGSQFHIWVGERDFRPFYRTLVIGNVIEGLGLCKTISNLRRYKNENGTFIITPDVIIQNCGRL